MTDYPYPTLYKIKRYASENGYFGEYGGYIYNKNNAKICHGWNEFYFMHKKEIDLFSMKRSKDDHSTIL